MISRVRRWRWSSDGSLVKTCRSKESMCPELAFAYSNSVSRSSSSMSMWRTSQHRVIFLPIFINDHRPHMDFSHSCKDCRRNGCTCTLLSVAPWVHTHLRILPSQRTAHHVPACSVWIRVSRRGCDPAAAVVQLWTVISSASRRRCPLRYQAIKL
jgi:hypothetical protein